MENRSQLLLLLQRATDTVRGQFHWGQTDADGDAVGLADENGHAVTFSGILLRQPRRSATKATTQIENEILQLLLVARLTQND